MQGVGAAIALQGVVAVAAVQQVVAAVAGECIGQCIASGVDIACAHQVDVVQLGAAQVGRGAGLQGVYAFASQFGDGVAAAADDVGVVARAAHQGVVGVRALQGVVARTTHQAVAQCVGGGTAGAEVGIGDGRVAARALLGPSELSRGTASALCGLHANGVHPCAEHQRQTGDLILEDAAVVQHHLAVDPDHDSVIRHAAEGVGASLKGRQSQVACPAGRKIVRIDHASGWAAHAPVKVDVGVLARQNGRAIPGGVVEVLGLEPVKQPCVGLCACGGEHIVARAACQGVCPAVAADQGVVTRAAVQVVVADIADQHIVAGIAHAGVAACAGEDQALQAAAQREAAEAGEDGVGAGRVGDGVGCVVHHIGVVATAAHQRVGADAAIDQVGVAIAGDGVVQVVAEQADVAVGVLAREVFDERGQAEIDAPGVDGVGAAGGGFDHAGVEGVNKVGVIAIQPGQAGGIAVVAAKAACSHQRLGIGRAQPTDAPGVVQVQGLDIVGDGDSDGCVCAVADDPECVRAFAGQFGHHIGRVECAIAVVIEPVDVIARRADQRLRATVGTEAQIIVAAGAGDRDVGCAGDLYDLNIGGQGQGDGGEHVVCASTCGLHHHITSVVQIVSVITRAPDHGVGAQATSHCVVAGLADQRVIALVPRQVVGAAIASDAVVEVVAPAAEVGCAGQQQVLDVELQAQGLIAADGVGAATRQLHHAVAQVVDHIAVVPVATHHPVGTSATVQAVVAFGAIESINAGATDQRVVARATKQHGVHAAGSPRHGEVIAGAQGIGGGGPKQNLGIGPSVVKADGAQR